MPPSTLGKRAVAEQLVLFPLKFMRPSREGRSGAGLGRRVESTEAAQ